MRVLRAQTLMRNSALNGCEKFSVVIRKKHTKNICRCLSNQNGEDSAQNTLVQPPISIQPGVDRTAEETGVRQDELTASQNVPGELDKYVPGRRWSNLRPRTLKHEPGTVLGAAALVAGTAIGAGILALPAVTKDAGFVPSTSVLVAMYIYSVISGLLLAEVNINTQCELGSGAVSLQSMAKRTLGRPGAAVMSTAYVFLHYTLLVAYISRAGDSIAHFFDLPLPVCAAIFAASLGAVCFAAPPRVMDSINSTLLLLVVIAFLALVTLAAPGVEPERLLRADFGAVIDTLPVVALSFVFQNVVPVLVTSLEGDIDKIRKAIFLGVLVPLFMFVGWEAAMLGSVTIVEGGQFVDPVMTLKDSNQLVAPVIEVFSFLAIATSYIGFVLGLTDFFSDAFSLKSGQQQPLGYALTLIPPYILALTFPDIFFVALDLAGTYGVLVLFGVLPAAMAWSERYAQTTISRIEIVPGGKPVLLGMGFITVAIIANEITQSLQPGFAR